MPLAFTSLNHGTVAFGFFNIESHMLLMERYFFFADDFCRHVGELTANGVNRPLERTWPVYRIEDPGLVGDLMGAINGIRHTGFIGEVYRRFPFPALPEDFRQQTDSDTTRDIITAIIEKYADTIEMAVSVDALRQTVSLGEYHFDRHVFQALIRYVWQGGSLLNIFF
jgi:hypothetical protein